MLISQAKQILLHYKYTQSGQKSQKCVFFKAPESLDLSWSHAISTEDHISQFTADRPSTRPWWSRSACTVNCNLSLWGKMMCKKAPLFSWDCSMSTGNRKEPGYTGIPLTLENFLSCFCLFKQCEPHNATRLLLTKILEGWAPPTGKMKVMALPFSIPARYRSAA